MGYEVRMKIGRAIDYSNDKEEVNEISFLVDAEIDLSVIGGGALGKLVMKSQTAAEENKKESYYFYGSDGNSRITRDNYDAPFSPVEIDEVIAAIESDGDEYRRFKWALALLNSIKETTRNEFKVIFFAH